MGLEEQYKYKSDIELLIIANNVDSSYTLEATETAKSLLIVRHGNINIEEVLKEEYNRLNELSKKCSICQSDSVVYTEGFKLRKPGVSLPQAIISAGFIFGTFVREKGLEVKLTFRLCEKCLESRRITKNLARISYLDYDLHPMCEFYKPLGYINPEK